RCKSPLKAMDYAALGLPTLASDHPVYRGSLADGQGGMLVPNTPRAWHAAMSRFIRNAKLRRSLAARAHQAYLRSHTLLAQAGGRREMWEALAQERLISSRRPPPPLLLLEQ